MELPCIRYLIRLGRVHPPALWLALCAIPIAGIASEEKLPLWEAGAGIGVASIQDYRGSDQRHTYTVPIPYIVYRGDFLQVDRNKIRGLLFSTEKMSADISVFGTVPVESGENRARSGMPDLDSTLEIGPQLSFFLKQAEPSDYSLTLRLPIRTVQRFDSGFNGNAGTLFTPTLDLEWEPERAWKARVSAIALFADRKYHDYFYGVKPQYATAGRPAYSASGGYSGAQLFTTLSRRFSNIWVGAFLQADSLHGSTVEDSPLLKRKYSLSAGFGVSWVFAESKERVAPSK